MIIRKGGPPAFGPGDKGEGSGGSRAGAGRPKTKFSHVSRDVYVAAESEYMKSLSPEEILAIQNYSKGMLYKPLNAKLRGTAQKGKAIEDYSDADLKRGYDNLMSAMKPLPFSTTVFRGANMDKPIKIGDEFLDKAFVSTGLRTNDADSFITGFNDNNGRRRFIKIRVPAGTPAIMYNGFNEHEIILPPNTKFRVIGREEVDDDLELFETEIVK